MIVDETSMVSLSLMARLVEAVRPQARLVLVGDPGQLTSIEAGAVLGDIVGPADDDAADRDRRGHRRAQTASTASAAPSPRWPRRSGAATPTRRSTALADAPDEVTWLPVDADARRALAPVRDGAVAAARAVIDAARAGDARAGARRARQLPRPVRAPPRALRRGDVDGPDRALARQRGRRLRRRGPVVRRAAAARDRERLRPAPLQRRHRRRRRHRDRPRERRLRAPRRA